MHSGPGTRAAMDSFTMDCARCTADLTSAEKKISSLQYQDNVILNKGNQNNSEIYLTYHNKLMYYLGINDTTIIQHVN